MNRGIQPRPHPVDALINLARALTVRDRCQLVMACGTGKTLTGRWHAQASDAARTLVLVPSLALLAQTLGEWRRARGWPFEALVVCSDPTTSAGAAQRALTDDGDGGDVDDPHRATVRARVTTSARDAADFLNRKVDGRPQVVFSTYHSAPVVARAQQLSTAVFDLAVCDEAHRLAGSPREELRTDPWTTRDWFGPVAHTVSFRAAIDAGLLTDYQVLVVAGKAGDPADDDRSPTTVPAALLDGIDRHGIRRVLSFHGRVAKARAFTEAVDLADTGQRRGEFA